MRNPAAWSVGFLLSVSVWTSHGVAYFILRGHSEHQRWVSGLLNMTFGWLVDRMKWGRASWCLVEVLVFFFAMGLSQTGAQRRAESLMDLQPKGWRFEIETSVKGRPQSAATSGFQHHRASLKIKMLISAHATEASFFGVVESDFPDFELSEGASKKLIWREDKCHQRRGLPKTSIIAIDGSIDSDRGNLKIEARKRELGLRLPTDELRHQTQIPSNQIPGGTAFAYRVSSSFSDLIVDVYLSAFDCDLNPQS
jgi:hypothetical protein